MKTCSKCGIEKPLSEFPRHRTDKTGYYSACKPCKSLEATAYRERNLAEVRRRSLEWHYKNLEQSKRNASAWRSANKDRKAEYWAKWATENREGYLRNKRERRDPAKSAMYCASRRVRRTSATPLWANRFFIEEAYRLAQLRTKLLGFKWVVDHNIPLKHPLVCGLHVETNLRVVPEVVNAKKGNRWSAESATVAD